MVPGVESYEKMLVITSRSNPSECREARAVLNVFTFIQSAIDCGKATNSSQRLPQIASQVSRTIFPIVVRATRKL